MFQLIGKRKACLPVFGTRQGEGRQRSQLKQCQEENKYETKEEEEGLWEGEQQYYIHRGGSVHVEERLVRKHGH